MLLSSVGIRSDMAAGALPSSPHGLDHLLCRGKSGFGFERLEDGSGILRGKCGARNRLIDQVKGALGRHEVMLASGSETGAVEGKAYCRKGFGGERRACAGKSSHAFKRC